MSYTRNIKYLVSRGIVYRQDPISDIPTIETEKYMFFENGTYECYTLFNTNAKITSYKSLKWHLYVLWYLNTTMNQDQFDNMAKVICDKKNGFVTFDISSWHYEKIVYDVLMSDLDEPPRNKLRKVIFKEHNMLTVSEKLSIVGKLIGKSSNVDAEAIYQCMLDINEFGKKITITGLAGLLDCSTRTIYRNMNNTLKKEKELLNQQL